MSWQGRVDEVYGNFRGGHAGRLSTDHWFKQAFSATREVLRNAAGIGAARGGVASRPGRYSAIGSHIQRYSGAI